MTAATVPGNLPHDSSWDLYKGWIVGSLIILAILVGATVLWFMHHP